MIPLIIGGVSLAATGYGLAKFLEHDCCSFFESNKEPSGSNESKKNSIKPFCVEFEDSRYELEEDESLASYDIAKMEIYSTTFAELIVALREISNLPESIDLPKQLRFVRSICSFKEISTELKQEFDNLEKILQGTKKYISNQLNALDAIIISGNDFEKYSDDDKALIQKQIHILQLVNHAVLSDITIDGISVAREVRRAYGKISLLID